MGRSISHARALRDAMAATKDFKGLTGVLACNVDGDCANPIIGVYVYHAGQYPPELIWPTQFVTYSNPINCKQWTKRGEQFLAPL